MQVKGTIVIGLAVIALIGAAIAADDPVAERRRIMQDNLRTEGKANQLVLGKYFPDKAVALMRKLEANMAAFIELFPPGSEGGASKAAPNVWTDTAGFKVSAAAFVDAAKAAEAAAADGQEACVSCHALYAPTVGQM